MDDTNTCPAVILAGGLGQRLRSVYSEGPKCLAPVGGRRFLEYLVVWLRAAGVRDLIVCSGYKAEDLRTWLGSGSEWGVSVEYTAENELLGTGGALKLAERFIHSESFFAMNGDSFCGIDLRQMQRYHSFHRGIATIAVVKQFHADRSGSVEMNEAGEILVFHEKRTIPDIAERPSMINGGVYLLRKEFFDLIPPATIVSLEKDVFPRLAGCGLRGFLSDSYFIDIGVPADFQRAQSELPGEVPP